jgi:hypothetical protein
MHCKVGELSWVAWEALAVDAHRMNGLTVFSRELS